MQSTVYHRLFERLNDLIPNLTSPLEDATFYAPPRLKGDVALHCTVCNVVGKVFKLAFSQDETIKTKPWMVFCVNANDQTAELIVMQDPWAYELVLENCELNPRRSQMNVFAVNCLSTVINLGGTFHYVTASAVEHI